MKRKLGLWMAWLAACLGFFCAESRAAESVEGVPWPATDALGRKSPLGVEAGAPRAERTVGIFYFLWHTGPNNKSPHWDGPYDIARILLFGPVCQRK